MCSRPAETKILYGIQPISTGKSSVLILQMAKACFEDGRHDTPVYLLKNLLANHTIKGPAIIIDQNK